MDKPKFYVIIKRVCGSWSSFSSRSSRDIVGLALTKQEAEFKVWLHNNKNRESNQHYDISYDYEETTIIDHIEKKGKDWDTFVKGKVAQLEKSILKVTECASEDMSNSVKLLEELNTYK